MEFGLDQLRTGLRPGSSRFELSRHVKIARTCYRTWSQTGSKPNSITLSWSQTGPRLVTDLLAHVSSLLVIGQIPARCRSATSFGPVCDQDSAMEFGF